MASAGDTFIGSFEYNTDLFDAATIKRLSRHFQYLLTAIAVELCVPLYAWSVTTGLARIEGAPIYGTAEPEQATSRKNSTSNQKW